MLILALLPLAAPPPQDAALQEQSELRSWSHMPPVGDINGDGIADVVHEHDRVLTLVSGADPTKKLSSFLVAAFYPEHAGPTWAVGPDVDGDGTRDLAVLNGFALVSTIFIDVFSGRTGMSLGRTAAELPGHMMSITWTDDIDGDGLGDLAVSSYRTQAYSSKTLKALWSISTPKSGFDGTSPMGGGVDAREQVALSEDFDGDGIHDLAIGIKYHEPGARAFQLGAERNFSYAMLSGATGVVIKDAPRVPMDAVPIETFAWLHGDWLQAPSEGESEPVIEESWGTPAAGMMLGTSRTFIEGASEGQFEFLRLCCDGREVWLHPSPGGQQADPFRLKSYGATEAVFENLKHDFPQVIRYWRDGEGLNASIGTAESPEAMTFAFRGR